MSRAVKWVVAAGSLAVLLAAGIAIGMEWRARHWENRWRDFKAHWEARGEVFVQQPLHGMPAGGNDNFFEHPWFLQHRGREKELSARLGPERIEGFHDWSEEVVMAEPLARRVLSHYDACAGDFAALRDAAARPQCRIRFQLGLEDSVAPWQFDLLGSLRDALGAQAAAEFARGDETGGVNDLVLMLEIGRHVRNSGILLGTVIGAGYEAEAYRSINAPWRPELSGESRARLLAALDLRAAPIGEELAVILRRERNQVLGLIDHLAGASSLLPEFPTTALSSLSQSRRVFIARNRLALCEDAQRLLFAPDGEVRKELDPAAIPDFEEAVGQRFQWAKDNREESLAGGFHLAIHGIAPSLLRMEEEREAARAALR